MGPVLRRALGGLLVCSLLVTALAYYTYSPYLMLTVQTGPPSAAEPASSPTPKATRAAPTPTPASSPDAPDADVPPDPGVGDPGIRLVATVRPNLVFDVIETVRLPARVTSLTLQPPDLGEASADLSSARPVATDVKVRVNGSAVRLPRRTVQRKMTVVLRRATDRFEVSYRLTRAIKVNDPSWRGRAIGAVAPLVSRVPGDLPVAVSFPGKAASNVSCPRLPPDQVTCFGGDQPHVRVDHPLAYRDALVQVQLDLQLATRKGR